MKTKGLKFSWLIGSLFVIGLMATGIAIFGITFLGSLSIAELEAQRYAERDQSLARLVFESHLKSIEDQLRTTAVDQDLIDSVNEYDSGKATRILELAGQNSSGALPDVLILDHEKQMGWLNASLALVDVGAVLPGQTLRTMPPDVWRFYSDQSTDQPTNLAVIAIPVINPEDGRVIARLIGGSLINDSFTLLDSLSNVLSVQDIAIVHRNQTLASYGVFTDPAHVQEVLALLGDKSNVLWEAKLFTKSVLEAGDSGSPIYVIAEEPSDTLNNIEDTYLDIFFPFLLYIGIASIAAAYLVNQITASSLASLVSYASARADNNKSEQFEQGRIAEYNLLGSLFDKAFASVQKTNAQFRELIDGSLQGIVIHSNSKILYVNDALLQILGYDADEIDQLVGQSIWKIYAPEEHERMRNYRRIREVGGVAPTVYEVIAHSKSCDPIWIEQHVRMTTWNDAPAIHTTITDISDRKEQEKLIEQHANYDALTSLPNRNLFLDRLRQSLAQQEKTDATGAVLIIDIDRFKAVNDLYGHEVGDPILQTIAKRIETIVDSSDTVSRIGGDEFAVLLTDTEDDWEIERIAQDILHNISRKINAEAGKEIVLTASAGISVYPFDGTTETALLKQAEAARNQAKSDGGDRFRFFSKKMNERATRALRLEAALRRAIENDQLEIHIQPIIECVSGTVAGCEALARWNDPELGIVSPGEFIPIAEDTGLIVPLGKQVLKKACEFYRECTERGYDLGGIGVNISPRQCREDGFINFVKATLDETDISPRSLTLEITESMMFDDSQIDPVALLTAIKSLGVKISLDDFGTGYSSLSYLKRLPIDTLKIDRSFIKDIETDKDDQALVNAIVTMAHALSIGVICEGVETRKQNTILMHMGCREIQGFYFGKPMPQDEFFEFLEEEPFKAELQLKVS
ncbi:EAL domain-containing protein [Labrenzia sp. PHM005]|uniref:EAL domain-containing protein n=1 Tax=Labrenzia sp. PHM005 TaxID=2590016 RepID=UPI0011405AB3|nr:EAL domain-containing protein [Labrenzia sp. PHM005]QDG74754.1 EAL domain-containing protein [Labrenzia sp. PHM005]